MGEGDPGRKPKAPMDSEDVGGSKVGKARESKFAGNVDDAINGIEDLASEFSKVAQATIGSGVELFVGGLRVLADAASDMEQSGRRNLRARADEAREEAEEEELEPGRRAQRNAARITRDLAKAASRSLDRTAETFSRAADRFAQTYDKAQRRSDDEELDAPGGKGKSEP